MKKYHLFEVIGVELEYMLVKRNDLQVFPAVDQLLTKKNGSLTSDIDNGKISWSNELVAHVVELKTNGPTKDLNSLSNEFHQNIKEVNLLLESLDAVLLPTASHPLMNPKTDTQLWKHSYSEVYALYNRIFDCSGHGWSNVQSMHLNLPFYDDAEFEKLHAAIRVLLPIIPGLSASSPIFEGKNTGYKDARMQVYKTNQKEIPVMAGKVIPEQVFTKDNYYHQIFEPINKAIQPFDTENILDHHFLNSRGAIARFDRNAIEIRVIDIQECPKADVAIAILIVEVLKFLVRKEELEKQKSWHEDALFNILEESIQYAEEAKITNLAYLQLFDIQEPKRVGEVWLHLYTQVKNSISVENQKVIVEILENGSLSTRILKSLSSDFTSENIQKTYRKLRDCLVKNEVFLP